MNIRTSDASFKAFVRRYQYLIATNVMGMVLGKLMPLTSFTSCSEGVSLSGNALGVSHITIGASAGVVALALTLLMTAFAKYSRGVAVFATVATATLCLFIFYHFVMVS